MIIQAGRRGSRRGVTVVALATGFGVASVDVTAVNLAGASIRDGLDASVAGITWIIDGYALTFSALLMLAGGLANRFGARRVYLWGLVIFAAASLVCASAGSVAGLTAGRLVQGAGAALFMPASLMLLAHAFPQPAERARMLGLWAAIVGTGSALGPTLGGLVVATLGWPAVFLVNLPICGLGGLLILRFVDEAPVRHAALGSTGHLLWIAMLGAVTFALIEGPRAGWTAGPVLGGYAVAVIGLLLLIGRERGTETPVMPWPLFHRAGVAGTASVGFLFNAALFGTLFLLGLYIQDVRGASPWQAGWWLAPLTVCFPLANLVYARIAGRIRNGVLLTACLGVAAGSTLGLVTVSETTPVWLIVVVVGVANAGAGLVSPALVAVLLDAVGLAEAGVAGSALTTTRQIGSLVGIAAVGAVVQATGGWEHGVAVSFAVLGSAYAGAAVIGWRLLVKDTGSGPCRDAETLPRLPDPEPYIRPGEHNLSKPAQ